MLSKSCISVVLPFSTFVAPIRKYLTFVVFSKRNIILEGKSSYLALDKDGSEYWHFEFPTRKAIDHKSDGMFVLLNNGMIKSLIGRNLSWEDEPVEISSLMGENIKLAYNV